MQHACSSNQCTPCTKHLCHMQVLTNMHVGPVTCCMNTISCRESEVKVFYSQTQACIKCITRFIAHEYHKLSMNILPHDITQTHKCSKRARVYKDSCRLVGLLCCRRAASSGCQFLGDSVHLGLQSFLPSNSV